MTHPVHPAVLARYLAMRKRHRSVGVPGSLTAECEIRSLDPYGLLSMAEELGGDKVRERLRGNARRADVEELGWEL